jgi:hypothetical protein
MNTCRWILTTLAVAAAILIPLSSASATTLDKNFRMGDDPGEAAFNSGVPIANGGTVNVGTRDSQGVAGQGQLEHLGQFNTPVYRSITGRPDGVGGFGIEFNAAQSEYLRGTYLNNPQNTPAHEHPSATLNYYQIRDRGLQFWVRPSTAAGTQSLVMDSNQHGVRINGGVFSMRYNNTDYPSSAAVTADTWYHVEVVRPATAASGSQMFVNGVAVAAASGNYNEADEAPLVVGSNTGGTISAFTGGNAEFFSGIIDDLKMFVIGQAPVCTTANGGCTPTRPAADYGAFNFATDNEYADFRLTGVVGDLNHSGTLTQVDKDAFIAGWLDKKVINGIQIGDLETYEQGDINFDGITNIFDLALMQSALSGAGMGGITEADLLRATVPEPASLVLVLAALGTAGCIRRSRQRRS